MKKKIDFNLANFYGCVSSNIPRNDDGSIDKDELDEIFDR